MLTKFFTLLSPHERKRAAALMGMILIMAILEMLGIASILPFITMLTNPDMLQTSPVIKFAFEQSRYIGIYTVKDFMFSLGVLVFLLLVVSLGFKALTIYSQIRFALMLEYSIGKRLVEAYINQRYSWFLNRNSTDLGKTVLSEVQAVIVSGVIPLTTLVAQSTVATSLLILLLIVEPWLSLNVCVVLGVAYASIYAVMGGQLKRLGQTRLQSNQERFALVAEAFGAIKEVKVGVLEQVYIGRFAKPAKTYAIGQASAHVIGQLPRFAMEAIAFGGLLIVILFLMAKGGSFSAALPVIALYAFAGYRLMPALQQIYGALALLRFVGPSLDLLHKEFNSVATADTHDAYSSPPLKLSNSIQLDRLSYSYPNASNLTLRDINITIPVHSKVGFVGTTGSGKTTVIDVILGLLEPQDGQLVVDGHPINDGNRRQWQRNIGYVPQNIYLTDDSVAANIAFGVQRDNINYEALELAAKIANLHEFVTKELPQGYATAVGERGVRLSGGQRQRIGIARALYHNPAVLILDEATSALDNLTEQAVMEAVSNLGRDITVIMIAHRLSTVRQCDQIILMERGQVKAKGTFEEVAHTNPQFWQMTPSLQLNKDR